jgi:parvulin-like peptidyl-prolyl isomerase
VVHPGRSAAIPLIALVLPVAAAAGAMACRGRGADSAEAAASVIAKVGERAITREEFESFLAAALGGATEGAAAGAELKSRLLDQFLDEELLMGEAGQLGLAVSDEEVTQFLPDPAGDVNAARRVLTQRKLKDKVILAGVSVSEEEVRRHFAQHEAEFRQPARVVVRQILLDTIEEARRVREDLSRHPERFEEIAETRSLAPDGGQPHAYEEKVLPDAVRAAVGELKEGQLGPVIEDPQGFFIMMLEERQAAREPDLEESRHEIELHLLQEKSQKKYEDYVTALRERAKVEVFADRLGFAYTKGDH